MIETKENYNLHLADPQLGPNLMWSDLEEKLLEL
jgi:hypothetical protein